MMASNDDMYAAVRPVARALSVDRKLGTEWLELQFELGAGADRHPEPADGR